MVSEKFRYQLRQEVDQWQAEGIIDRSIYEHLANRYQFGELDTASRNRFVIILLGLGSVLLGLAVITFVAANWQAWSRELKVILLLSLFIGVSASGFFLWTAPQSWQSRFGQTLLLLGGLILGANIALMSQMFHQSGAAYQLYLVWGLGVLAMAYSLRLTSLGMLALILTTMGYCLGVTQVGFGSGYEVQHMPLLASAAFIPLAYWCRSRWLFAGGAILATLALEINLAGLLVELDLSTFGVGIIAVGFVIPTALLWAYQDSLWGLHWAYFDPVARRLAILFLALGLYGFSFHYFWLNAPDLAGEKSGNGLLLDPVVLGGLALYAWWRLGCRWGRWRLNSTSMLIGGIIAITAFVFWWHLSIGAVGAIATFIFNALLALLAINLVRHALASGTRLGFWGGIFLIVLQLLSRMLEYNTGLLFKAIVLFLCGIAIMAAGVWFERYLRRFNAKEVISFSKSN